MKAMKGFLVLAVVLGVVRASILNDAYEAVSGLFITAEDNVVVLTDDNFDDFVKENDKVLVEFYAPWCGHCKKLEPEYKKAANALKAEGASTVLAKVDATVETRLAKEYEVRGFPTLKYFTSGEVGEYGGGRDEKTIVSWIQKRELPAVTDIADGDALDAFAKKSTLAVVGFFEAGSDEEKAFRGLADAKRDSYAFGVSTSKDVAEAAGGTFPGVTLYTQFGVDEADRKFETDKINASAFGKEDIEKFLLAEKFPLVDEIGPDNYRDYMDRGLPIVWIAVDTKDAAAQKAILANVKDASKANKGKLSFTYVDGVQYEGHVKNLGITSTPGMVIVNNDTNEKFKFDGNLNEQADVDAFFTKFAAGEIPAFVKSQPVPETNDEPVYVLVGDNFKEVANDESKDVLVEFYAPWCGHCKKLAPEYEKLGEAFTDRDDVVIAKLDATENDTPENISGFPTLVFYPRGGASSEKYEGARTADALIKFIKGKVPEAEAAAASDDGEAAAEDPKDEL